MMPFITKEEFYQFYKKDREVFSCLVIKLARNPAQSLLVMALWLRLENTGFPNVISKLASLLDTLFNAQANEAETCLKWLELENAPVPNSGSLSLTSTLIHGETSLQLFSQKRFTAITGIKSILNKICARIFTDILQNILCSTGTVLPNTYRPSIVPGFPHPLFGPFTIPPINFVELDLSDPKIWENKGPCDDVTDDDKTMFVTFSRGIPVTEEEVRHLFTNYFGDCIKVLNMGNADTSDQVLFATMVLKNVETVDRILNAKHIAKFQINGKHIWTRKYEQ
ncbi:hypothetical protein JHK82_014534 [Glycine max]|uniref:RRM domain-containing protein n=1 Tax=Glycine soja TaxID=3848 RepID=A0A445K5I5_GLYSO|nr:hypothetical protein JHK87_014446 [Glycine soja]KAG5030923.1 hypothetical protein JHK85_014905 [Glycine max]KAG5147653.1 hypothetical protein JHK82_014534 [Glycine max]RZC06089.1 hypothetical protein D0Y65_013915 [Glycine soja]